MTYETNQHLRVSVVNTGGQDPLAQLKADFTLSTGQDFETRRYSLAGGTSVSPIGNNSVAYPTQNQNSSFANTMIYAVSNTTLPSVSNGHVDIGYYTVLGQLVSTSPIVGGIVQDTTYGVTSPFVLLENIAPTLPPTDSILLAPLSITPGVGFLIPNLDTQTDYVNNKPYPVQWVSRLFSTAFPDSLTLLAYNRADWAFGAGSTSGSLTYGVFNTLRLHPQQCATFAGGIPLNVGTGLNTSIWGVAHGSVTAADNETNNHWNGPLNLFSPAGSPAQEVEVLISGDAA